MNKDQLEQQLREAGDIIALKDAQIKELTTSLAMATNNANALMQLSQKQGKQMEQLSSTNAMLVRANVSHAATLELQASSVLNMIVKAQEKEEPPPQTPTEVPVTTAE